MSPIYAGVSLSSAFYILSTSRAWIRLIPEKEAFGIFLERDLAAMLVFMTKSKSAMHHPDAGVLGKFLV
ncbi:hypothetical protein AA14337_1685 [Acetobacter malorum DSM 14337]|uniref:Uncharacterized protein n=1 Tax=Acetobacter malorum DSM 14337 TaxID=1307910 RepID=A0ABQ0PSZ9_9PROT|nr:hypothetical protein AD930_15375 [Acetobacter malorum]GBQ80292.1 hypothetical protein AA14337_1685 [Acetobacter malorum DSM 14337]